VKRKDLAWVFLPNGPPEKPPVGLCRLQLSAGERLTGKPLALADGKLRLAWNGRELEVPWDLVRAVESPGERMLYLSELKPSAEKNEAAIGPTRALGVDRAADGRPLRLAARAYERGLGMRASAEAAYRLDGRWKHFRALAGLDQEAARASRGAVFQIIGDGKKLFEKKLLPGEAPAPVDVDIGGVKELRLVLEAGPGLEIGDYGDWADARLLR
jgi:alpha-galactosidase